MTIAARIPQTPSVAQMRVRVWGELACFTKPENKVERFSYPLMTPSAARGVLEAIFWKPQFAWRVDYIDVIRSGRYTQLKRNEVKSRASVANARKEASGAAQHYDAADDRTQRYTLALRDVEYVIGAHIELLPSASHNLAAYQDQFRRRLRQGRCFQQPYLGLREFAAFFAEAPHDLPREDWSVGLGQMLLDIDYVDSTNGGAAEFFDANVEHGRLVIPHAPAWLTRRTASAGNV